MPRPKRSEIFTPNEVSILHVVQRCVRRAYLSGLDEVTGKDFSYRKEWIRQRIEKLASVFGVDVLSYAIMSNHLHVVLRNRPDVVEAWSDRQVALRWLQIFPGKRIDEQLGDPTTQDVDTLANDPQRIATVRERLSDISWFMKALSEPIARLANRQDECTGAFWQGRFRAQRIIDEAGLLACCMYVDLNPIRAAMAESLEKSQYTSAFDRIESIKGKEIESSAATMQTINKEEAATILKSSTPEQLKNRRKAAANRKGPKIPRDGWLAPMTLNPRSHGPVAHKQGLRASDKGFLSISLEDYLKLLDWTGRQGRPDKRGKIPAEQIAIVERLGIEGGMWCDLVWSFKRYFGRSRGAGSPDRMREMAVKGDLSFHPGQRRARVCFASG